uniref:Mago-bind domain-containing protein n=1 Tax=Strongyloides venezuelensis TaxID=75913 RepID=A0A0K0FHN0_STRVS
MFKRIIRTKLNCLLEEPDDPVVNKSSVKLYEEGEEKYTRDYKAKNGRSWEPAEIQKFHGPNLYVVKTNTVPNKLVHTSQMKSNNTVQKLNNIFQKPVSGRQKPEMGFGQTWSNFSRPKNSRSTRNENPVYK